LALRIKTHIKMSEKCNIEPAPQKIERMGNHSKITPDIIFVVDVEDFDFISGCSEPPPWRRSLQSRRIVASVTRYAAHTQIRPFKLKNNAYDERFDSTTFLRHFIVERLFFLPTFYVRWFGLRVYFVYSYGLLTRFLPRNAFALP
jgi:hypothetical protein